MTTQVAQPAPNIEYSLALGPSFAPEAGEEVETSYAALRYDFRPASADLEQPGVLLLGKDNRVSLYLANSATCEWDVLLSGKYESYSGTAGTSQNGKDCLDCVALFDPTTGTFRLETLLGQYNTKHIRDAAPYRAPADSPTGLSPGTSGSAGPGPSTSPPGPRTHRPSGVGSPLGTEDATAPVAVATTGPGHRLGGPLHERPHGGVGLGSSRPPRAPTAAGGGGRSGGGPGKKRQREGAAVGVGGGGQSPSGVSARKTSRLARASGPRSRLKAQGEQPAAATAGREAHTAAVTGPGGVQSFSLHPEPSPQPVPSVPDDGAGGEDDVDAELLDAFDTIGEDPEEEVGGGGGDEEGSGDAGAAGVDAQETMAADGAEAEELVAEAQAEEVAAEEALPEFLSLELPGADGAAVAGGGVAVTPEMEAAHEVEEEEAQQEEEQEPVPSPPRARLVVDMMDDDEGYHYNGEEEYGIGLGIEYF